MKLTALEIKQQKFDKSLRGYDADEVQAFLNTVASEWEHLVSRNRELEQKISSLEDKLKHYERVEQALHETLQTAKESAEHKLNGAREEADNMVKKAEMEANNIVREAQQQRQLIRQDIIRLADKREDIIGSIGSYLDRAQQALDNFDKAEPELYKVPEIKSEWINKDKRAEPDTDDSEEQEIAELDTTEENSAEKEMDVEITGEDSETGTDTDKNKNADTVEEDQQEKDKKKNNNIFDFPKKHSITPDTDDVDNIIDEID